MWNPFRTVKLKASVIEDVPPASCDDGVISDEINKAQLRSMLSRTKISMIYGQLARDALAIRLGDKINAKNY